MARPRTALVFAAVTVVSATGCPLNHPSFLGTPSDVTVIDVADASDVIDASDVSDVSDASDVTDVTDARDVTDASDVSDASDVTDASDVSDASDARDVTDATDVADASDATDVTDAPDTTDTSDVADATDAPVDTGPTCAASEFLCDGVCVNPLTSNANCGRCGNACTAPETCLGGSCACPGGARACDGLCVDLLINTNHCGRCGNACTAPQTCVDGACTCPGARTLCGSQCVSLATDSNNCGRCGDPCGAGITCVAGVCVCPTNYTWCDGRCVYLPADRSNCGACGNVCGTGSNCVSSVCQTTLVCGAGTADCNGMAGDFCEVNINTALQHCGRCGHSCAAGERCEAGVCAPPRHCRDIHTNWPDLASGLYNIFPESPSTAVSVWCDMDTSGGGWTVIYMNPGQRRPPAMIDYTVNNLAIPRAATEALIAYRDTSYRVTDPAWASFPIPSAWQSASPFRAQNSDVMVRVTQATGAPAMHNLRFGYAEFGNDCHSGWDTRSNGGRICIDGTSAPFFCEFVSSTFSDRCPNSNQRYDAADCSTGRRFSIAVR